MTTTIQLPVAVVKRISYPAPHRQPVLTPNGWRSIPWTMEGILETVKAGGWFSPIPTRHEFETACAPFAQEAMLVMEAFRDE